MNILQPAAAKRLCTPDVEGESLVLDCFKNVRQAKELLEENTVDAGAYVKKVSVLKIRKSNVNEEKKKCHIGKKVLSPYLLALISFSHHVLVFKQDLSKSY